MTPTSVCRRGLAVLAVCALMAAPARAGEVLVFAAASLKTALERIADDYEAGGGAQIVLSFAGSPVLARQIQYGAPAQLFLSANAGWMDVLDDQGLINTESRVNLLGNSLVLIAEFDEGDPTKIGPGFDLAERLDGGHLAMALVDAVPAGIYGKAALEQLGLWPTVADRVAQADNVRAALALVASGATPLGIVYRSDAVAENRVSIVGTFPATSHPPIVYPAALTVNAGEEARDFLAYLQGPAARMVFDAQGFTLPEG